MYRRKLPIIISHVSQYLDVRHLRRTGAEERPNPPGDTNSDHGVDGTNEEGLAENDGVEVQDRDFDEGNERHPQEIGRVDELDDMLVPATLIEIEYPEPSHTFVKRIRTSGPPITETSPTCSPKPHLRIATASRA